MYSLYKIFCILTIALLSFSDCLCRPESYRLTFDGGSIKSQPTIKGVLYRITVQGSISFTWEQQCREMDAMYLYSLKQSDINAGEWPPVNYSDVDSMFLHNGKTDPWDSLTEAQKEEVRKNTPLFSPTTYVGDSSTWYIPHRYPKYGIKEKYRLRMIEHVGFRVNGSPMPKSYYDPRSHRYTMDILGTGEPITFTIINNIFVDSLRRNISRRKRNCGVLLIDVERMMFDPEKGGELDICDLMPIKDQAGKTVAVKLRARILVNDTSSVNGKLNVLQEKSGNIAVIHNGKFVDCNAELSCKNIRDTTDSETAQPISVGFLVDHSSSMGERMLHREDRISRWSAVKEAMFSMLEKLGSIDQAQINFISTKTELGIPWTTLDSKGKSAIFEVMKGPFISGATALYDGVIIGTNFMVSGRNKRKIFIIISDGVNTAGSYSLRQASEHLTKFYNGELYVVAPGLDTTIQSQKEGVDILRTMIAEHPNSTLFVSNKAQEIKHFFTRIAESTRSEECCTFFFDVPPCTGPDDKEHTIRIVYTVNGEVRERTITYNTECAE